MSEAGKRGRASWATSGAWVIYSLNLFVFLPLRVVVSLPIPSNDMPGTAFFLAQQTDEVCPLPQQEIKQGPPRAQTWVEMEARDKPPVSWPLGGRGELVSWDRGGLCPLYHPEQPCTIM